MRTLTRAFLPRRRNGSGGVPRQPVSRSARVLTLALATSLSLLLGHGLPARSDGGSQAPEAPKSNAAPTPRAPLFPEDAHLGREIRVDRARVYLGALAALLSRQSRVPLSVDDRKAPVSGLDMTVSLTGPCVT